MRDLASLLQLADAAFPAGTFAHSFGLETAIAEGSVRDEPTLEHWLRRYLDGVLAPLDGAALVLLMRDGVATAELDERLSAAQANAELRRANAHLARATLETYAAMGLTSGALAAYASALVAGGCDGHHVIAAALGYAANRTPWRIALAAHATTTVATLASVAARAIPLGQRAVARTRWALRAEIDRAVARAAAVRSIDDLATSAPSLEIDGLRHRRLDGRLFAS